MKTTVRTIILVLLSSLFLIACSGGVNSPSGLSEGSTAPDFTLDNALGGTTSLADYEGKPVLLYFHMAVG